MFRNQRVIVNFGRRAFSSAKPSDYKPKTTFQVWTGDSGAYPIMAIISFACVMATCATLYRSFYNNNPDAQIDKTVRKSLFRGNVKDE